MSVQFLTAAEAARQSETVRDGQVEKLAVFCADKREEIDNVIAAEIKDAINSGYLGVSISNIILRYMDAFQVYAKISNLTSRKDLDALVLTLINAPALRALGYNVGRRPNSVYYYDIILSWEGAV